MIFANHDLKLIFIHIPKCGGSYVSNILRKYYGFTQFMSELNGVRRDDHLDFCGGDIERDMEDHSVYSIRTRGIVRYLLNNSKHREVFGMDDDKWRDYHKITFVRDPYDKLVSAYNWLKNTGCQQLKKKDAAYMSSFKLFINSAGLVSHLAYCHAFIPQYEHLLDYDGNVIVDYVADFSRIDEELCGVLRGMGVVDIVHMDAENAPFVGPDSYIRNKSTRQFPHTHEYYDQEDLDIVNTMFAADFEYFGFLKCATIAALEHRVQYK